MVGVSVMVGVIVGVFVQVGVIVNELRTTGVSVKGSVDVACISTVSTNTGPSPGVQEGGNRRWVGVELGIKSLGGSVGGASGFRADVGFRNNTKKYIQTSAVAARMITVRKSSVLRFIS